MGKQRGRLERGVFFDVKARGRALYFFFPPKMAHIAFSRTEEEEEESNKNRRGERRGETGTLAFLSGGGIITTSPFPDSQWAPKSYLEIKPFQKRRREKGGGKIWETYLELPSRILARQTY